MIAIYLSDTAFAYLLDLYFHVVCEFLFHRRNCDLSLAIDGFHLLSFVFECSLDLSVDLFLRCEQSLNLVFHLFLFYN